MSVVGRKYIQIQINTDLSTTKHKMKQIDYYHAKHPLTKKYVCYSIYETIHQIAKMATRGDFNTELSLLNIENLNKIRGMGASKENYPSFHWMHNEKEGTEITLDVFFQVYGFSVKR